MLKGLRNLKYQGGKDGLLFFICDVLGCNGVKIRDAEVICSHAFGKRYLFVEDLINYCTTFGWINTTSDTIFLSPSLISYINDKEKLNNELILSTVEQLFTGNIMDSTMFSYDSVQCYYSFKNELLPLSLSSVRNTLISQGFLIPIRDKQGTRFYISPSFDIILSKYCQEKRKQLSLERLKKILEENELAGEKAELFVLDFEKKRIGEPLCNNIKRISDIDVSAGFDIVSFNSLNSLKPDRFIEVKAISNISFYWSRNEYEIAKLKGEMYYLYLVELTKINEIGYIPEIIRNPAKEIMETDKWFVESESYHIKRI